MDPFTYLGFDVLVGGECGIGDLHESAHGDELCDLAHIAVVVSQHLHRRHVVLDVMIQLRQILGDATLTHTHIERHDIGDRQILIEGLTWLLTT